MGITPTIEVANLGMADSLILMVLALVVFGPRRLPKIGRQIGKLMYEFRKASNDFKYQMEEELRNAEEADRRKREEEERQRRLAAPQPAQVEATPQAPDVESSQVSDSQASEAEAEALSEAGLRVNPPATGAPVAAERPTSRAVEAGATEEAAAQVVAPDAETAAASEVPLTGEAAVMGEVPAAKPPVDEGRQETEPAAYHG